MPRKAKAENGAPLTPVAGGPGETARATAEQSEAEVKAAIERVESEGPDTDGSIPAEDGPLTATDIAEVAQKFEEIKEGNAERLADPYKGEKQTLGILQKYEEDLNADIEAARKKITKLESEIYVNECMLTKIEENKKYVQGHLPTQLPLNLNDEIPDAVKSDPGFEDPLLPFPGPTDEPPIISGCKTGFIIIGKPRSCNWCESAETCDKKVFLDDPDAVPTRAIDAEEPLKKVA